MASWILAGSTALALLSTAVPAVAAFPAVRLSPYVGPPTTGLIVKGRGFGANEVVDLAFDGTNVAQATTNGSGAFTGSLTVPAAALPGPHTVTATGETSGRTGSAPFTVRTDWTKFHFDLANSGVNPYENVLDASNVSGLTLDWSADTGGGLDSAPAVVNGVVYVASAGIGAGYAGVSAYDAASGTLLWKRLTHGEDPSNVTLWGGMVFVGTTLDDIIHAYNAVTGKPMWSFQADGFVDTPVVSGGVLYAGTLAGSVYALDARTGSLMWTVNEPASLFPSVSTPALANGVLYLGAWNTHTFFALNAATGATLWTYTTGDDINSSPAGVNGVVYFGSDDSKLYALDATTGHFLWSTATNGGIDSSPAVANGVVYVGSNDDYVYAFDAGTGSLLWKHKTGRPIQLGSPVVANGVVYIGSEDQRVYALDPDTGVFLWSYTTGGLVTVAPAVVDGILYVGSSDHSIYTFHLP